jgi:PadR family transcriptional regulator PadR
MQAEMLKGHLDTIVLAALEPGPAHGYAIIDAIRRKSDETFDLPEGTIYPALHRLEEGGLLASSWMTPVGGRKRRVYALTPKGRDALAERRRVWGRFSRAVDTMLGKGRAWPA